MAIQINKLTKKYGDLTAVDNLDLHIPKKEVFALLGPNGAGKTTTVRMLTRLTIPTGGKALINGQDVTSNKVKKEIRGCSPAHEPGLRTNGLGKLRTARPFAQDAAG